MSRDAESDGWVIRGADRYDDLVARVNVALGRGEEVKAQIPRGLLDSLRRYQINIRQLSREAERKSGLNAALDANDKVLASKANAYTSLRASYGSRLNFRVEGDFI
ncbi:hypothetical protein CMO88_04205 [Candidatus Woesearchaeota archaeon]|nr:hypothetical protein [Candidatus Woesearchaeota archaeon]|tara:strand:- start:10537 stop:10854 length:318 start_codon:yes stop_codon:yes gene_type:complete